MHDTDTADLIEFAKRWAALGDAITEQVEQVLEDPGCGSCWTEGSERGVNPAAIRIALERLQGLSDEIDDALAEFIDAAE